MKNIIKTGLVAFTLVSLLSSCGGGDKSKSDKDSTQTESATPADTAGVHTDSTRKDTTIVKTDTAFNADGVDTIKKSVVKSSVVKKKTTQKD